MTTSEKASALFAQGFNCSQAVFVAYAEELGLEREAALKVSSAFGGGISRRGEVCGAVTGALMALGLAAGHTTPDKESKERTYRLGHAFIETFEARHGSALCRELLCGRLDDPESMERARQQNLFTTVCPRLVADAVALLDDLLQKQTAE